MKCGCRRTHEVAMGVAIGVVKSEITGGEEELERLLSGNKVTVGQEGEAYCVSTWPCVTLGNEHRRLQMASRKDFEHFAIKMVNG